jgi:hypothetical protein
MPEPGSTMKFKNHKNKLERPFIVYADNEARNVKNNDPDEKEMTNHVINSCCYYFVCTFDNSRNQIKTFTGENCIVEMIIELFQLAATCINEMRENEKMKLSKEDRINFHNADSCYLCGACFDESKALCKVIDHDHRTGKYRGACHAKCNINYFSNRYLPVVVHNLRGYDSHLIISEAFKLKSKNKCNSKFFRKVYVFYT